MVKTKKVKRQNKGGHGKKKRIFTMKHRGGGFFDRFTKPTAKVAPAESETWRDSSDTTSSSDLKNQISNQAFNHGTTATPSHTTSPSFEIQSDGSGYNPTSESDFTHKYVNINTLAENQKKQQPNALQNVINQQKGINQIRNLRQTQKQDNQFNQKVEEDANALSAISMNTPAPSILVTPPTVTVPNNNANALSASTDYSSIVTDSTSSTNMDKTYIVKYKLINGIPQEKEVFVQDPVNKTYTRYQFYSSGTPKKCNEIENNMLGNYLNIPYNKDDCGVSLAPLGQTH